MDENLLETIKKIVMQELQEKKPDTEKEGKIPIGVSARHAHISQEHLEILFGEGYSLSINKILMGGQFASNEKVTIVSKSQKTIENVRILGPVRKNSQIEISSTDAMKLGIKAPIRDSGDIKNSEPMTIVGPKGSVYLQEGCIIAKRHVHMSEQDAINFNVTDSQMIQIKMGTDRETIFSQVKVRVDKDYTLEMHIDTDEANASNVKTGDFGYIQKQ